MSIDVKALIVITVLIFVFTFLAVGLEEYQNRKNNKKQ